MVSRDDLETRWQELGRVLVARSPALMEHALLLFERATVAIADEQDRVDTSESGAT